MMVSVKAVPPPPGTDRLPPMFPHPYAESARPGRIRQTLHLPRGERPVPVGAHGGLILPRLYHLSLIPSTLLQYKIEG